MKKSKGRLKKFRSMQDSEIDYSDIPRLNEEFWKNAKVRLPNSKKAISLRIDDDVLTWFKSQGPGYQSLMNAVLKSFAEAKKSAPAKKNP